MAGMNLHAAGTRPPPLCPHGIHVLRRCDMCRAPERHLSAQERAIHAFIQEHGEEALRCPSCSHHEFRREVTEKWSRTQYASFENARVDHYDAYGSQGSAEYYDDMDEDSWECTSCEATLNFPDLADLCEELEKDTY